MTQVGSITQTVNGNADALLFAASSDPFTSVVVQTDRNALGFAVAEMRYSTVPLPGALWLTGPGLVGLAAVRRRLFKR